MNETPPKNLIPLFPGAIPCGTGGIPQTASQNNRPQVGQVDLPPAPLTADEIRSQLVSQFERVKPQLEIYHEYANRCVTLAQAYHDARFKEVFPSVSVEELTLAASLDARETPKSLDVKLAQIQEAKISVKHIIFDRVKSTYLLFV